MSERLTVVLLHGLARRAGSLAGLGRALEDAGFATWACDYPSRRAPIAEAAARVAEHIAAALPDRPLAAVTHSLGGVLLRHLADPRLDWQRVVMLAPPNQGSQVAGALAHTRWIRWFYGPAGQQLAGDPSRWPLPPAPAAIIAGTRKRALGNPTSWVSGRVFAAGVEHDGTVAVDETRLPGAAFATVDATHTWIMNHADTRCLTIEFLRRGGFSAPP
jgi:hypothetical protein